MERNTLLAIVLSAVVLFTYQSIFVPPKRVEALKNSQIIAAQYVGTNSTVFNGSSSNDYQKPTSIPEKKDDYNLETPDTVFYFSKMGGSLHSIKLLNNKPFPVTDVLSVNGLEDVPYIGEQVSNDSVSLMYADKNWQISKTYDVKDKNLIKVRMEIKNLSEISILNNFTFTAFEIDESKMENSINGRDFTLHEYSVYANNKIFRKGLSGGKFGAGNFSDKNNKTGSADVSWLGFRDHYNAFIVKPKFETKGYEIKADSDKQLNVTIKPQDKSLAPGESATYDFEIYVGPQDPWIMKKYEAGFEKIVVFSNFSVIEWIGQAIYHIIPVFHSIFKSWGVAIVLISLLIYGITYPLTMKSMISMRKMQEVQPKIAALKERYKNDSQKLNTEMMEIYRREKINPLGGCLPFVIQMPFFMALYQILWRAQYFQGQGFLWIKDLSQPDRLIIFPFYLPFFGNELNILPIMTGCIMFVQQKISSKNIVITDEQQAMQQKMMKYILPVMMTCMFYKFASSWAIYFFIFYILSTVTQWRIAKLSGKK